VALARARRQSSARQRLGAARQASKSQLGAFDTCLAFWLGRVATGESHGGALAVAASWHQAHPARAKARSGCDVAARSETSGGGWLVDDATARCFGCCPRPGTSEQAAPADGSRPGCDSHALEFAAGRATATCPASPAFGGSRCAVCACSETGSGFCAETASRGGPSRLQTRAEAARAAQHRRRPAQRFGESTGHHPAPAERGSAASVTAGGATGRASATAAAASFFAATLAARERDCQRRTE
jgi:hypothetical protein